MLFKTTGSAVKIIAWISHLHEICETAGAANDVTTGIFGDGSLLSLPAKAGNPVTPGLRRTECSPLPEGGPDLTYADFVTC
jgi:hypothetical protein